MSIRPPLYRLAMAVALALLAACRPDAPRPTQPPQPSADTPPSVKPSTDLRGASDHPQAAPAIGALTAGQAEGGARRQPMQPSGGDGTQAASAPASAARRP